MTPEQMWEDEDPIKYREGLDLDVPDWIEQDISPSDVAAIVQGGCASGAYMPAVTYHDALETMQRYGDRSDGVLQYIQDYTGELPQPSPDESWSGIAVFFLSYAVELWASAAYDALESYDAEEEEEEDEA